MKARIKATGEIVEVNQCSILYDDGRRELMYGKELEEVQGAPDYWTRLEHQAAIAAMQGFISSKRGLNIETDMYDIPHYSQMLAHALVQKMKEERK